MGRGRWGNDEQRQVFDTSYSTGELTYTPSQAAMTPNEIVDQLATLLTSGRLSPKKRQILTELFKAEYTTEESVLSVGSLIAATPEFHASGVSRMSETRREEEEPPVPSNKPYKAVVYFILEGGLDRYVFDRAGPHQSEYWPLPKPYTIAHFPSIVVTATTCWFLINVLDLYGDSTNPCVVDWPSRPLNAVE